MAFVVLILLLTLEPVLILAHLSLSEPSADSVQRRSGLKECQPAQETEIFGVTLGSPEASFTFPRYSASWVAFLGSNKNTVFKNN